MQSPPEPCTRQYSQVQAINYTILAAEILKQSGNQVVPENQTSGLQQLPAPDLTTNQMTPVAETSQSSSSHQVSDHLPDVDNTIQGASQPELNLPSVIQAVFSSGEPVSSNSSQMPISLNDGIPMARLYHKKLKLRSGKRNLLI